MATKRPPRQPEAPPPTDVDDTPIAPQSNYRPEFCAIARDYIGRGHTTASLRAKLKLEDGSIAAHSKQTILNWRKQFPEFDKAMAEGEAMRAELIEDVAFRNAAGGHGQLTGLLLRNWSDITEESTVVNKQANGVSTESFERMYDEDPAGAIAKLKEDIDQFARIEGSELPS